MPRIKPAPSELQKTAEATEDVRYPVTLENYRLDMQNLKLPDTLTAQEKTTLCFKLTQDLSLGFHQCDVAYMKIGMMLAIVKDNKLYKHHAEHVTSWREYIKDIAIGIDTRHADRIIKLYKEFGPDIIANGRRIRLTRLDKLSKMLGTKEGINREEWLTKAEELPLKAFEDEVREAEGKTPSDACSHPEEKIESVRRCTVCNKWLK